MASILFSYNLQDAWCKNIREILITDDESNNVLCFNHQEHSLSLNSVDKKTIERIKERIRKNNEAFLINDYYSGDSDIVDGCINSFFINDNGQHKTLRILNMWDVRGEVIRPLKAMVNEIKNILVYNNIEEDYFAFCF